MRVRGQAEAQYKYDNAPEGPQQLGWLVIILCSLMKKYRTYQDGKLLLFSDPVLLVSLTIYCCTISLPVAVKVSRSLSLVKAERVRIVDKE